MKKKLLIVLFVLLSFVVFAQPNDTTMSNGLSAFSSSLFDSIPNASTQVGNWPDAWIGKFFPSFPPHFGVGASVGFTSLDTSGIATAAKEIGIDGIDSSLYLPTIAVDARIGGLFLPFDIGLSFMTLNNMDLFGTPLTVDYLVVGGSLRYAILQGNLILPKVSVGAGYMYNQTGVKASISGASVATELKSQTVYVEAQISKQFLLLVTPYVGVRLLLSESENAWNWSALTHSDEETDSVALFDDPRVQLNVGASFNFLITQLTVGASYDVMGEIFSGNASLRVKL